ncbi:MAG: hypothetical protein H7A40_02570 [Chlamydiales bacterium]|nr:hypothetical protein [Chlamydiales bacterium]
MSELSFASNQIDLNDYDIKEDVKRRTMLANLSQVEYEIWDEILFSPSTFSIKKMVTNLKLSEETLIPILENLMQENFLTAEADSFVVNKEMRKSFEDEFDRFEDIPGIEALKNLLKRVPIHVLPNWYPIPRTSDNIFDSIVDKFLQTPQKYQRYLLELNFSEPTASSIVQDVMSSPEYKVSSKQIMSKYHLSHEQFEEIMIYLEFNFVCCLGHELEGDTWIEVVTFFKEWRDYLLFIKNNKPRPIRDLGSIIRTRPSDFAFVEDMGTIVNIAAKEGLAVEDGFTYTVSDAHAEKIARRLGHFDLNKPDAFRAYLHKLINKALLIQLAQLVDGELKVTADGLEWLQMSPDKRAVELHRHPFNRICIEGPAQDLVNERNVRIIEKSLETVADSGWVFLDDFLKGALIALDEEKAVTLERKGRHWQYTLPEYSESETAFISTIIMDWLFDCSVVATGQVNGRSCFCVTPFGQTFYD